jgi:hypothetical protein
MWTQSHSNGVRSFGLARRRYQNSQPAPYYAALLATPDRSDADRQADKRRDRVSHPAMNKTKTAR